MCSEMIMMRSTSMTKMAKPPPPIPPRPSKAVVAEALAKTRRSPVNTQKTAVQKPLSPTRCAPPPPFSKQGRNGDADDIFLPVIRSQSHSTVSLVNKKPLKIQRSTSHIENEPKENSRTVVFHSSNLKASRIEVKLMRNESDRKHVNEIKCNDRSNDNSTTSPTVSEEHASDASFDDNTDRNVISTVNTNADTNWNDVLNGKNHVNTLIDEMFASILDIPDEKSTLPEALNANVNGVSLCPNIEDEISVSADKTKIIVNNSNDVDKQEAGAPFTPPSTTVLIIDDGPASLEDAHNNGNSNNNLGSEVAEKRVKFDDKKNHELLISELQSMRKEQERILKRQRKPSLEVYDEDLPRIHRSDWVEVNDGQEVRLSSCQIIIDDGDNKHADSVADPLLSRLNMSLHGLPPLPKSLSGFSLLENQRNSQTPNRATPVRGATPPTPGFVSGQVVYPPHPRAVNGTPDPAPGRKATNLDNQLATLRREMYSLRQLDLSLLSQLWSLNESIQDFRQMLQEQDDRALSPPSPSPSPSSCDDGDADEFFSPSPMRLRPAPPPPPLRRTSNSSSANSSEYGTV